MTTKVGHLISKLWRKHGIKDKIHKCMSPIVIRTCSSETAKKYGFSEKDTKEFNFITNIIKPWAIKTPNQCALWLSDGNKSTKLSYIELLQKSQHLTNALHNIGSPKCAIVILPKISPWWIINMAGLFTGMIISPGTIMLTEKEVLYRLGCLNADTIFCSSDLMDTYDEVTKHLPYRIVVEENMEDIPSVLKNGWRSYHDLLQQGENLKTIEPIKDGAALALLFFTSGTTGNPKMVPHTQIGYTIGQLEVTRDIFRIKSSDVFWNLSDLGWAKSAFSSLYIPLIAGCTIFIHQKPRFDPKAVIQILNKEPITALCCPATALRTMVQEDLSPVRSSKLNRIFSSGEPLNPEVIEYFAVNTGKPIYEAYGQTETTVLIANRQDDVSRPGSMGKSSSNYDIVIVDDDCKEVENMKTGQIAISTKKSWPYGLCKEYYNNPEQTRKSFVNGLYLTGDKAFRDKDGYFWYVGRTDDVITSSGYRIGPFEVESALLEHPSVKESAVVASPDALRGHVVKAFIVLTDDYTSLVKDEDISNLKKDIQEFMKRTIAPYKYPRKMEFVENLPKTISGKIRRVELREKEFR